MGRNEEDIPRVKGGSNYFGNTVAVVALIIALFSLLIDVIEYHNHADVDISIAAVSYTHLTLPTN